MKILVPTDFSQPSAVAVNYAVLLAKSIKAEVILLHAVYFKGPVPAKAELRSSRITEAMIENTANDLERMVGEIKRKNGKGLKISYDLVKGSPLKEVIEAVCADMKIDLIVMGTKGAGGIKKIFMGSNAAAVIANSSVPVITVPEHARFKKIKRLVFASDLTNTKGELKTLGKFAGLFNSSVHILHVSYPGKRRADPEKLKKNISEGMNYQNVSADIVVSDNVEESIEKYVSKTRADLLVMFTHAPGLFEKLFGKSLTREMSFHTTVPLLSIKKKRK